MNPLLVLSVVALVAVFDASSVAAGKGKKNGDITVINYAPSNCGGGQCQPCSGARCSGAGMPIVQVAPAPVPVPVPVAHANHHGLGHDVRNGLGVAYAGHELNKMAHHGSNYHENPTLYGSHHHHHIHPSHATGAGLGANYIGHNAANGLGPLYAGHEIHNALNHHNPHHHQGPYDAYSGCPTGNCPLSGPKPNKFKSVFKKKHT